MIRTLTRLLCAVFILAPSYAHAQKPSLGINLVWLDQDKKTLDDRFQRAKSLGIDDIRIDWRWDEVQPQKSTPYNWQKTDVIVQLARKHELNILPIVHYAPLWATPRLQKEQGIYELAPSKAFFKDYADFVKASIERYKEITAWQIWNEPNIKQFWGPKPNAAHYSALLRKVSETISTLKHRDKIKIIHAGLSKADISYMWHLWDADKQHGQYFDVMAVHPYFFSPQGGIRGVSEVDSDVKDYAKLGMIGGPHDGGYLTKTFNLQLFMHLKGMPKPIWITEIGFITSNHPKNIWGVSEAKQAQLTNDTLHHITQNLTSMPFGKGKMGHLKANIQRVYWFALDDYPDPIGADIGYGNFGIYRPNGTLRPAGKVLKTF